MRPDPVRVAEEYATADVISRGRLEIGFVKSGDSEMVSGNANPVGYVERFWEAIDLIQKTLTSHDGPFSWEGKYYTHRHVNIWPPVYQRPHPPMWAATGDPETSAELGRRGMVNALVLRGPEASRRAFDAYRDARSEAGLPAPGTDRFAYAALCYVGDTDEEGIRVGSKTLWFLNTSLKQSPQMSKFLPGRTPAEVAAQNYRTAPRPGAQADLRPAESLIGITAEQAIARGILCAGNPDTVYKQIMDIYDKVGGFANFIFIGRSGFLDHQEAEKGIRMMAKEVLPRLPGSDTDTASRAAGGRMRGEAMNDATPWVDPELLAAGNCCSAAAWWRPTVPRRRSPRCVRRRTASARFLARALVPLRHERDLILARPAWSGAVPALSAGRCRAATA